MKQLIKNSPLPFLNTSREHNHLNGGDAESYGAALLLSATRGQISWGSREEDSKKTDLKFFAIHPWLKDVPLNIPIQIKSGKSNGEATKDGFKLKSIVVNSVKRAGTSCLVIWIDNETGNGYWAYIHPNTESRTKEYGSLHRISPETLYDVARCDTRFKPGFNSGGKRITISCKEKSISQLRAIAKSRYCRQMSIVNPVLGEVNLTRTGWRHMFRKSRNLSGKEASLRVIPHVATLLNNIPDEHFIPEYTYTKSGQFNIRSSAHT